MPRTKTTRNFSGSVIKREITRDGRKVTVYDARKRYTNKDGKPDQKFKRCRSAKEADTAIKNFEKVIEKELNGEPEIEVVEEKYTLRKLVAYFKKEHIKPAVHVDGLKIDGYKGHLGTLRRHLDTALKFFGDVELKALSYENIRQYRAHLATTTTRKGTLPKLSTVNRPLSTLKTMFEVGAQLGWLEKNPFRRGKQLINKSAETRRNRMLTFEEEIRLLAACVKRRKHLRPLIICALDTAMRQGEIFNLEWQQIDFDNKVIYIVDEFAVETKTGVEGIIPLTPRLINELKKIRRAQELADGNFAPNRHVFEIHNVYRSFTSVCKAAKIDNLQFRDLRSTAATRMMLAGNAGDLVRKVTRHTQEKTFRDHYTNVDIKNAQLIGERLADFVEFQNAWAKTKGNGLSEEKSKAA